MFALTMGPGSCLGFPDTCNTPTPVGPVPIPYPNISMSSTCSAPAATLLIDCTPTLNQLSEITVSQGDNMGVAGGVITGTDMGGTCFLLGSFTVFAEGPPIQRLTSMTGHNTPAMVPNGPGACLVPSQPTVLVLG